MNTQLHAHHHHASAMETPLATSARATLHCLTGCVIGEVTGLVIGVTAGMGVMQTMLLATGLAYVAGMSLGLLPVMRARHIGFLAALKIIWIGEVLSIGVMELVMNSVDYHVGGVQAGSILEPIFWIGIILAVPAGFVAAWPVNYWLLKRNMKACH